MEKTGMNTKARITQFYDAFARLDAAAMKACYADDAFFKDPAFGILEGDDIGMMWQMLCESQQGKEFKVTYRILSAEENAAKVHWEAEYTFSKTGRKVHNVIQANLTLETGLIKQHIDSFNLHNWAKQALGFQGWLLGGTSFFQKKLQQQTNGLLRKYIKKRSS
jgi:ketosteroid isomerase-like protein